MQTARAADRPPPDVRPLLRELLCGQAVLHQYVRREVDRQKEQAAETGADVRALKAWIMSDVLAKLQA